MTQERHPRRPRWWHFALGAAVMPLLFGLAAIWNARETARIGEARARSTDSFGKRLALGKLVARLEQAETSQRGYILTGDRSFLQPYRPARAAARTDLSRLSAAFAGDAAQHERLETVRRLVDRKFAEMDLLIARRDAAGLPAAVALVQEGEGRRLMEALRRATDAIGRVEQATSRTRAAALDANLARSRRGIAAAALVSLAALLGALALMWRQRVQRYHADLLAYDAAARNRTILDSTIDPIVIINPSGTIESINAAASRLLGYDRQELLRRDVASVLHLNDSGGTFHDRVGLSDGQIERPYLSDVRIRHRDGHDVAVDVALGVMRLPDGDHIVASIRDITERKRIEGLKDELVSTISHELRTPLTSVVGALGLLRAGSVGALPTGAARLIEIAENNSRRLIRLINDMLDIDRMHSGQLRIERHPVDLNDIVAQAGEGSLGLGHATGVTVRCVRGEALLPVTGDADRLLQVITNLVSNAVHVSPAGATVTIATRRDERDGKAIVTVDDEGPGVPAPFRDRIFGRFERAAGAKGLGTGLGLAISREIVERHDGRIWFEDRPGGGSRFAFALDLRRDPLRDGGEASRRERLLICEDDAGIAALLCDMVDALGYDARAVHSAREARAALEEDHYAALLLDLTLPDENGLGLARALRAAPDTARLPIIIVSGAGEGDGDGPVPVDLIDWVAKPVDADRLRRAIAVAVARSGAQRPTVLHLDDDPDVPDITAALMRGEARVVKATTLAGARALLASVVPDVAILDMHLGDGTGLDLLPLLVDRQGQPIPTIIYSAHEVDPATTARVAAVLVKSRRSLPDLRGTIRRIVRERGRGGA